MTDDSKLEVVMLDYGGVIAEEGFKKGILSIAGKNGIDPKKMIKIAFDAVYSLGFTKGKVDESVIWESIRQKTGIIGTDSELTDEVLSKFILRKYMITLVKWLKKKNIVLSILSDQTDWLDRLDNRDDFFKYFDFIFNSYHVGMTKKTRDFFDYAISKLNVTPDKILFVDDHLPNIERAKECGLKTIFYINKKDFLNRIHHYFCLPEILLEENNG